MVTLATLDFEEGTDGDPLVNVAGWTSFTGEGEYDSAQANTGALSGLFGVTTYGQYTYDFGDGTPAAQFRCRMYFRRGFSTMTGHPYLAQISDNANTYIGDLQVRNELGGRFRQRWGFNAHIAQAAATWPENEWTRVDLLYRGPDVAVNGWTAIVYTAADDTVEDYRLEVPSFNTGVRYLRIGNPANSGHPLWMDDVLLSDSLDDPGPAGGAPPAAGGLYVGGSQAQAVYAGASAAQRVYRGSTLIWEAP